MLPPSLSNQQSAFATFPGENGKIAFQSLKHAIYVMNPDGSGQTNISTDPAFDDFHPSWSPDGKKMAFTSTRDGNFEIYVMSSVGTNPKRLTNNPAFDGYPEWSPDGTKIAFVSSRDGNENIYVMASDGSGQTRLTNYPSLDFYPSWSPDGTTIAFVRDSYIFVMDPLGFGQKKLGDGVVGWSPDWSPDGTKIAFHKLSSPASVTNEIYVVNADGSGLKNISNDPALDYSAPSWSPDGTKIAFHRAPNDESGEIHLMNADGSGKTGALAIGFDSDFGPKKEEVPDKTPAVISVPENMTAEATGPDGARVSFEVSAQDAEDGPTDVSCDHNSGDTFPIGETLVTCTAEDLAGNRAEESFTITVRDTTAPDVESTKAVDKKGVAIAEGSITKSHYIQITFEATDAVGVDKIECSLDGQAFTSSCRTPVVYDRLKKGTHQVTERSTDAAEAAGSTHIEDVQKDWLQRRD
jgi:dipeptidyl aminopeptidase/acylaminoacyl peptidase